MADYGKAIAEKKNHQLTISRLADPGNTISFPGFITEFSDTFNSNWNPENVYGRMDPILNFQNTQRAISVTFRVAAEDELNMITNQNKLSILIQMLYPGYYDNSLSSAPLIRVDYVNYIPNLVCAIDTFDYTPNFDETQAWIDHENALAPTYFDIRLQLNILHEQIMGFNDEGSRAFGDFEVQQDPKPIGYGSRGSRELHALGVDLYNTRYPTSVADRVDRTGGEQLSRRDLRTRRSAGIRKQREIRGATALGGRTASSIVDTALDTAQAITLSEAEEAEANTQILGNGN